MSFIPPGTTRIGQYELIEQIGSGAFAQVWKAKHVVTNLVVAIKIVQKSNLDSQNARTRLAREVSLLKGCNHPFISSLFETLDTDDYLYMFIEYCENGNLMKMLSETGPLSEKTARHYFTQLISVLDYLHHQKMIAHRDLKAENILLDRYNNIRLIDFGLSNVFTSNNPEFKSACGSPAYASPEIIRGETYTCSADIWSAGILLFVLTTGKLPFDDDHVQRLLQKIVYTDVHYPSSMSPALSDLISKMLNKNPSERITIEKIKQHHWFSQAEYSVLPTIRENYIDKEIIGKMTAMGQDVHNIHQELLTHQSTNLTSIYRMLEREKMTESMSTLMETLDRQADMPKRDARVTMAPEVMRTFPMRSSQASGRQQQPFPSTNIQVSGQRILQTPTPVQIAGRRLSRPVVARRMDTPTSLITSAKES